jgi:adenine-specific DNA methylase
MSSKAKARKLIEVAMPIREVSTENGRDKSLRHGHISTLHLWWARRPLPVCRAVVFASLVPDPLDPACPPAFVAAVDQLLAGKEYKPYEDIPYTVITDKMEDNARNRLLCFIGRFSDELVAAEKLGKDVTSKKRLSDHSLIKWENKNNLRILTIARKLIYVAHNAEKDQGAAAGAMLRMYEQNYAAITTAEQALYDREDRHLPTPETNRLEQNLAESIEHYLTEMPSVFDPFAGGGAIPLEAARLGCRSFGNDINPVAHIIQRASLEFPQRYGKPITFSRAEYEHNYGADAWNIRYKEGHTFGEKTKVDNRLSHDVAYYANLLLSRVHNNIKDLYPDDPNDKEVIAYYWARTAFCTNPSCRAEVPLLRQFQLRSKKNKEVSFIPHIEGNIISLSISNSSNKAKGWIDRGNMTCPVCDSVTPVSLVKAQSIDEGLPLKLLAVVTTTGKGKQYRLPNDAEILAGGSNDFSYTPLTEHMHRHSAGGDTFSWGINMWRQLFTPRQSTGLQNFVDELDKLKTSWRKPTGYLTDYQKVISVYLATWVDRIAVMSTSFGLWKPSGEFISSVFGRQAIAMVFDFPEVNPFCNSSGSAANQLYWITTYIKSESSSPFSTKLQNASSGEQDQFAAKSITAVVTDPPYYDAIAYADLSDFFYVWLKRTLADVFPSNFATPQTPKSEECTALKHHHENSKSKANTHFENKLQEIFIAINLQVQDIVSIMFAHQKTEAWTTLCNSILGASMNIEASWAIDSERSVRNVALAGDALKSSVTVACKPVEKIGYADYNEIKEEIANAIAKQVKELYALGFRGADLLTACFGQAVSVFGRYKAVEKPNGDPVTVGELLDLAREMAFRSIINDVDTDEVTQFYLGWLASSGFAAADHDMVRKVTQIGLNIDTSRLDHYNILIADGNKQSLADSHQRFQANNNLGLKEDAPDIDRIHRLFRLLDNNNRPELLNFIHDNAPTTESPLWRVMNSLKELLPPDHDDGKIVATLLASQEVLLRHAREQQETSTTQGQLDLK